MATLATIPLEILLLILQKLDAVDVVRLGMVSRTSQRHQLPDQCLNQPRHVEISTNPHKLVTSG